MLGDFHDKDAWPAVNVFVLVFSEDPGVGVATRLEDLGGLPPQAGRAGYAPSYGGWDAARCRVAEAGRR
jgi:hypothetical protein